MSDSVHGHVASKPHFNLRVWGCAAVLIVLGLVIAALTRWVLWARSEALASQAQCPLNQLELAMHNYHEEYGCLPPAYVADASGRPIHSWRVLLLPFVEQRELYEQYDFSESWDGPNNLLLADQMPRIFHCPSEPESATYTNYVVIRGPDTPFPGEETTSFDDFADGLGQTIFIAEIANSSICWLEPRDLDVEEMSFSVNDQTKPSLSSSRRRGPYVVFGDSISAHWVSGSLAPEALEAMTTIAGHEPLFVAETAGVGLTSPAPGPATDTALKSIKDWRGLHTLWLNDSPITDAGLGVFRAATDLDSLTLRGTPVTDQGLKQFQGTTVVTLDLSTTRVTDAGLQHLATTGVEFLDVRDTSVTTTGVARLLDSRPLTWFQFPAGTFNEGRLILRGSSVTEEDVQKFQSIGGIRSIVLDGTIITDACLAILAEMPGLESVSLQGTRITDAGLEHLVKLQGLTSLDLSDTTITDKGLEHLKVLSGLKQVYVNRTQISDAGLKHLEPLTKLTYVDLRGTSVSEEAAQQLKTVLPEAWINRE